MKLKVTMEGGGICGIVHGVSPDLNHKSNGEKVTTTDREKEEHQEPHPPTV